MVRVCDYYITWTHDLLPQGRYHFDADGKLTGSVAPLKNGIYEEDGSLYYYRNGERTYAGLMPEGYYSFDSAGRMILDSETE